MSEIVEMPTAALNRLSNEMLSQDRSALQEEVSTLKMKIEYLRIERDNYLRKYIQTKHELDGSFSDVIATYGESL